LPWLSVKQLGIKLANIGEKEEMSMPYCKIMLCTDGSEFAVGAERVALALAKKCQAELIGYSVFEWNEELFSQLPQHIESRMSALKVYHEELKKKLIEQEIAYEYIIDLKDEPVFAIVEQAEKQNVDLIVMGRHGRRGLLKLLIGSVTQGVLAHTKKHVCVAPRTASPKGGPVLVPVDGSESSKRAAEFSIIILGERYKPERLIFLHVVHPGTDTQKVEVLIDQFIEKAIEKEVPSEKMILSGVPDEVICNTADKADFIVMGKRGLTGLKKIVFGSTSEKVAGLTNRAVIVVQ
jgi:nucleotide-binding universal stress UspA family protein